MKLAGSSLRGAGTPAKHCVVSLNRVFTALTPEASRSILASCRDGQHQFSLYNEIHISTSKVVLPLNH